MKGLLLKDLMISKRSLISITCIFLIMIFISLGMRSDYSLISDGTLSFITVIFSVLLSINLFANDETCKWNNYVLSLPVSKRQLVLGRYVYLLLAIFTATCLSFLLSVASGKPLQVEIILQILSSVAVSLVLIGLLVPLMYYFGTQTARIILMGVFFVFFILISLLKKMPISISEPSDQFIIYIIALSYGVSVLLYYLSYLISRKIVEQKDIQ